MRKLKLDVTDLQVESFSIAGPFGQEGTVRGRMPINPDKPIPPSDNCPPGGNNTVGTCIGPTYCCNPTANTGCCPPATDGCPQTAYYDTCNCVTLPEYTCIP